MNFKFLSDIIQNVYENCRISRDKRSEMCNIRDIIENALRKDLRNITFIKQGSHATYTQLSSSKDLDVDIGIIFNNDIRDHKIFSIKLKIMHVLCNDPMIVELFENIECGERCIKLFLRIQELGHIRFEIAVYKKVYGKLYFAFGNDWKIDNKQSQMKYLKRKIAQNPDTRKIIMFLKCIASLNAKWKGKFKSIIITEIVITNYKNNNNSLGQKLFEMLLRFRRRILKQFVLYVSCNEDNKENLFNNDFRQEDKSKFIDCLDELIYDIVQMCEHNTLKHCYFIDATKKYCLNFIPNWVREYREKQQLWYLHNLFLNSYGYEFV